MEYIACSNGRIEISPVGSALAVGKLVPSDLILKTSDGSQFFSYSNCVFLG